MIHVLDQDTINQIAAGEVIERPMAVVKELIENSIDAGATAITIEIRDGGISFIRVTDNGIGMEKEDIHTAFLRHATSKIKSVEDLLSVQSLGFRGEALSSIAAVSQVELITKKSDQISGFRYEIAGGEPRGMEEVGCPDGTTFIMRNLFFNTPARHKFLKSKTTEGNYIQDLILRYSLSHAEIRFHFISDGKTKLQTSGDGKRKTNIFYHYGPDITKCLIPIEARSETMHLFGFIGKPELSRSNRTFMNYFVNGRYIKSTILTSAIENAYKEFLMNHRHPFTCLMLSIDSRFIDVNVHPTKMEIRFTNREEVYDLFYHAIYRALKEITLIPEVSVEKSSEKKSETDFFRSVLSEKSPEPFEKNFEKKQENPWAVPQTSTLIKEAPPSPSKSFTQMNLLKDEMVVGDKPQYRIIGQVFGTYWLVEYHEELLIIDQHAAHEKVLYEKLMRQLRSNQAMTQNLIAPIVVTLSGKEITILEEYKDVFVQLGFQLESFGDKEYLITGVPANFLNLASKELFLEMLDSLMDENPGNAPEGVLDHCATMACKAAVKGNHTMSMEEADALISQMLMAEQPYHCPHGRPTTIAMSQYEFDKKFKRIL